jgi:hypothetical protein
MYNWRVTLFVIDLACLLEVIITCSIIVIVLGFVDNEAILENLSLVWRQVTLKMLHSLSFLEERDLLRLRRPFSVDVTLGINCSRVFLLLQGQSWL